MRLKKAVFGHEVTEHTLAFAAFCSRNLTACALTSSFDREQQEHFSSLYAEFLCGLEHGIKLLFASTVCTSSCGGRSGFCRLSFHIP